MQCYWLIIRKSKMRFASYPDGDHGHFVPLCSPLVTSFDRPQLPAADKINGGHPKEQAEKLPPFPALEGMLFSSLVPLRVTTSEDEHYAVYNYFNQQLHQPVVAYGDAFVDDETQFLLFSRFKISLSMKQ